MVKIKKLKLKPSARDKRRYFLVKASNAKVESAILEYVGTLGFAKSAYMEIQNSELRPLRSQNSVDGKSRTQNSELRFQRGTGEGEREFIIGSCLVKSLEDVRAALALAGIKIEKVSGTLKGLKR